MATKRSGGSNIGLIVTLVGFVLLSVIVSVLAYMGFDGQAKFKAEKDTAVADAKKAKDKGEWYRFQADVYRSYMGKPIADTKLAALQEQKKTFDGGTALPGAGDEEAEVRKLIGELNGKMPWDADKSTAPGSNYEQLLKDKDNDIARIAKGASDSVLAQQAAETSQREAEAKQAAAEKLQKDLKASDAADTIAYTTFAKGVNDKVDANLTAAKERDDQRAANTGVLADKTKLEKQMKALQARVDNATRDLKTARDEMEDAKTRLAALAERSGIDPRVMSAEMLDATAAQVLKSWDRNWQVVAMDRKGEMPYINLGSSDGLKPQVTFSIHAVSPDGKLSSTPKGTLEVVRVIGAKQAQARITSIKDKNKDPILKGDRLFNPTWDPSRKKRVAIAGLADMGDGTDSTEELKRLLDRQSVLVDAYVDTKDEKAPRLLSGQKKDGKDVAGEVTTNTDYLILADNLEQVRHAKANTPAYRKTFDEQVKKMKEQAASNGVPVIALKKYLDMIGYRPSRVATTGTGR